MAEIIKKCKDGKYFVFDPDKDMLLASHESDNGHYNYYKHRVGDMVYFYVYSPRTHYFRFLTRDEMEATYQLVHGFILRQKQKGNLLENGV